MDVRVERNVMLYLKPVELKKDVSKLSENGSRFILVYG